MNKKLLLLSAFVAAIALASIWASPRSSDASSWVPNFGPTDFYSLVPATAGANGDTHAQFNVFPPSANFSALFGNAITFGDSDVFTQTAAGIPGTGAYIGSLSSVAQLGLANEGCNTQVTVVFNFIDANVQVQALAMAGAPTLTAAIAAGDGSFTYTSAGSVDPLGPSDDNPAHTRAEIQIDAEQMLITAVNEAAPAAGGTYTVTRGWNGTAPAAHGAGAAILGLNVIFAAGPTSNLLANQGQDDGDFDNNGVVEFPALGGNQVADGADGIVDSVRDSYDPNGNPDDGGAITPRARYWGLAFVANALIVTLQFVIADPGALTVFPNLDWATAAWGYSSSTFLQDVKAPPSNSAISDFCNFSSNTFLFGVPHDNSCTGAAPPAGCTGAGAGFTLRLAVDGGCPGVSVPNECGNQDGGPAEVVRSINPAVAQRVRYYQYSVSQRDYDDDGHENALDVCAYDANAAWDPREFNVSSGADTDGDGLPNACDASPAVFNNDQDGDAWQNRIDVCPETANAAPGGGGGEVENTFQYDRDVPSGVDTPDGGPASDSIGPACDIAGNSCGGCVGVLTPNGANGHYHATAAAQTICVGAVTDECSSTLDADGDGVVNARDTCIGLAPNPPAANAPFTFGPGPGNATLTAAEAIGSTVLNVGAGETAGFTPGSPIVVNSPLETVRYIVSIDTIGNTITINLGLTAAHAIGNVVAQVNFAQSMRDTNNDGFADISDVSALTGVFGSQGGDPAQDGVGDSAPPGYQGRFDLNYDRFVDISDVSAMTGVFGATCGPA